MEVFDPTTNVTSTLTPTRTLPLYPRTFQTSRPGEIFTADPPTPASGTPSRAP